jgi:ATP-dependent Lhr-like helicase
MQSMKLHPALDAWFRSKFPRLTDIQTKALRHTLHGRNALILAPTGSGKTLAAFLSVLSELAADPLPNATCAIYLSPLKALSRDISRNLEEPLAALNAALPPDRQIRMQVRTGDTKAAERGKQKRKRPHLLLTTVESLSAMLSQSGWRDDGFQPRTVVVDEIHAFAENKRGSLLALTLERLSVRAARPPQRIGISATAWPIDAVTRLLCGDLPCSIAQVDVRKVHQLDIAVPPPDLWLPPAGYNTYRVASPVADLVNKAHCSLAFTTTRSAAEKLALALKYLLPELEDQIAVHHGSVDAAERNAIEAALSTGALRAVVCSSSLELGVDFQAVDQVLLIGAPRGVSRALQRLGRSGHRVEGVARGSLVPLSLPDLMQCIALREAAEAGHLDRLRVPVAPLDVLAQVLLAMSIERPWRLDDAFDLVRRAGPYACLQRRDFDDIIEYLCGGGKVLGPYGTFGKIILEGDTFRVASQRVARDFYLNSGVISDDYQVRIVTNRRQRIGEVEAGFLESLQPNEAFVIGGRVVKIKHMEPGIAVVAPATGERVRTPRWMGGKMSLTAELAQQERILRRQVRDAIHKGGVPACIRVLQRNWHTPTAGAERIAEFLLRQEQAAGIPVEEPVLVERIDSRRTSLFIFHVVAGRSVNRSLAWVIAQRLEPGASIVANFDDHSLLISIDRKLAPDEARLRECFNPDGWLEDLSRVIRSAPTLGYRFRHVAETGQLLLRRALTRGGLRRPSTWSAPILYATLREHEPDHPLVREAIREMLEDECDAPAAFHEAARLYRAEWDLRTLPRPSPFALPLFAAFNRETLMAQEPDRALEDLASSIYMEWVQ